MPTALNGWFSENEISSFNRHLTLIAGTRRSFSEGYRREPSEYRDLITASGSREASIIRSLISANGYLVGAEESNFEINNNKLFQIQNCDLLTKLELGDLFEFSLIADAQDDQEAEKIGLKPVLVWIFRRNGHAIIHYHTLMTNEIDSLVVRAPIIKENSSILSGYSYRMSIDKVGLVFRTQPILLPPKFSWSKIINNIEKFIEPSLNGNCRFIGDYDKFKVVFRLSTEEWWPKADQKV